jgi:outer membrane protein assembly factor BamB
VSEARWSPAWVRRAAFAAVLIVAAVTPGPASGSFSSSCSGRRCESAGAVQWARLLPGSWLARPGVDGTVPAGGQAYAAINDQVAAVGTGLTVIAYQADDGQPLWTSALAGFPPGSAIVAIRVWPGAVTAGVDVPDPAGGRSREEVVLAAGTGRQLHVYPAASFGGAVAAGPGRTVIVGARAVTSYDRSGRVRWSTPTGQAAQAWQLDGGSIYVTVAKGGYLSTAPVTALRKISLRTGAEHLIRPRRGAFAGSLSLAFDDVVLFISAGGLTAYSGKTGRKLWKRPGALAEGVDPPSARIYLASGNVLLGVSPHTGQTEATVAGVTAAGSSGLYGVQASTMFGLDHGAQGQAWGYDVATQRVIWASGSLPWPHYFVDLSGIGGSTSPGLDVVLLAICNQLGPAPASGTGQPCTRPELVAVSR